MATVNKDFKIKSGLIVEGTTATVNGYDILTKKQADQDYIVNLIGGTATSANTPNTVVKRDVDGNFAAGIITAETALSTDTINIGGVGVIESQDDDDFYITAQNGYDIRMDASDDLRLRALGGDVVIGSLNGHTRFSDGTVHIGFPATTENEVATKGYVDDSINNIDLTFNTDEISEGSTNLYYTDARVDSHLSGGDGISYSAGTISADVANGLHISNDQIQINRGTVDGWYDASGAAATAQSNAEDYADGLAVNYDAAGLAAAALVDANEYTDAEIITALSTAQGYATTAEQNANAYTDNAVSGLNWKQAVNLLYDAAIPVLSGSGATQLAVDGHAALGDSDTGYRLLLTGATSPGIYVYESTGGSWTLTRSTDADTYEELIGAAVYVMEGTQYGSTSWVQSNHYLTGFTGQSWTQFSGQGSVTAGTGITVDGLEVSVNRTDVDTWYDESGAAGIVQTNLDDHALDTGTHGVGEIVGASENQTLTNKTIDAASNTLSNIANTSLTNSSITVNGYSTDLGSSVTLDTDDVAEGASKYFTDVRAKESAANLLTNASLTNITITGDENGLTITAENGVDDSTTDDLDEGLTNQYFTDVRAKNSAADLLTGATLTNITITGSGSGLTITAEDGIAGKTTDDLAEGSTNKYFSDSLALTAIEDANIQPSSIDITNYRREEATWTDVPTASQVVCHQAGSGEGSMKYLVRVTASVGGTRHSHVTELLATVDGSNGVAVVEYGTIYTSENPLATATVLWNGLTNCYELNVTTANNNSEVMVAATLMAAVD